MRKFTLLFFLILVMFTSNVQAVESTNQQIEESTEIQYLYDYINNLKNQYEILRDVDASTYIKEFMRTGESKLSIKTFFKAINTYIFKEIFGVFRLMAVLIIIAIICALLTNLQSAFSNDSLSNIAYFACYALLIIIIAKSFFIGVDIAKTTINGLRDFLGALLPVLMMLLASIGGFTEAIMLDPIIIACTNIFSLIFADIIIPIILMSFVLQFVNNISEDYKINNLTKLLNQIALWSQGFIMTIFIAILTIRGIAAKTIDEVTVKTAKFAIDNFVPIVGKCLSDAVSTVAGYSILLKNSISSLGLIIIFVIGMFPIIKLLIMALVYKLTAALIEPISDSRLVNSISSAGDSIILIMSCLISVSVMSFIMIAIIASAGKMIITG